MDATNDLALVKINAEDSFKPLVFRHAPPRLGEHILAVGFPLSDLVKVTTGNVNALAGLRNVTRYIQISRPIQPGNSGELMVGRASARLFSLASQRDADFGQRAKRDGDQQGVNTSVDDRSGALRPATVAAQSFLIRSEDFGGDTDAADDPHDTTDKDYPSHDPGEFCENHLPPTLI